MVATAKLKIHDIVWLSSVLQLFQYRLFVFDPTEYVAIGIRLQSKCIDKSCKVGGQDVSHEVTQGPVVGAVKFRKNDELLCRD